MDDKRYVLYADDDEDDREIFIDHFNSIQHFRLVTFHNGAELLSYLKTASSLDCICLIILDINMPVLTGVETLERLMKNEEYMNIPAVLFSTSGSPSDRKAAEGFDTEIILKPASYKGVGETINTLLQRCRQPGKKVA